MQKNMFRKVGVLLLIAISSLGTKVYAQDSVSESAGITEKETETIVRNLDSLTNLHLFDLKQRPSLVKRLNKYGFRTDDVPTYEPNVYDYRIRHLDGGIPFVYNQYVQPYIDLYSVRKRGLTEKAMGLSQYYFPMFEEELEKANLPHSLKYLAVVESALNPFATSPVGATGIWQFMYGTAKMYDLKINYFIDERRDPAAATRAAVKFFKDLYSIYNDWLLVVAAYNCGPGNVNRAIRKSGGKMDFWSIRQYLPEETRGYVPAFIAVNYVMNYTAEHNLYPTPLKTLPTQSDIVMVKGPVNFNVISQYIDVNEETLALLNPHLKQKSVPKSFESYPLRLPVKLVGVWDKFKDTIYAATLPQYNSQPEIVKEVTDSGYAKASNSSEVPSNISTIFNSNSKSEDNTASDSGQNDEATTSNKKLAYTVKRGDNLRQIADNFDVEVAEVKRWNKLSSTKIRVGQKLAIYKDQKESQTYAQVENYSSSKKRSISDTKQRYSTYTVRKGDTLWSISNKFSKMTVADLKKINKLRNTSLKAGMKLKVIKG